MMKTMGLLSLDIFERNLKTHYFAKNWPPGDCLQRLWFDILDIVRFTNRKEWMNEWKDGGITVDGNNFKRKTWGNISVFHVIASTYSEHWTAQLEHLSSLVRSHLQCWLMMLQRVKKAGGAWTVASTVAVQRSRAVIRWRAPARVLQAGLVATVIHVSESIPVTILAKVVIWWHHNFHSGKNSRTVAFIAIFLPRNDVC